MGYDARYEAVCKYTDEGVTQSKDFLSFLKKRQALENDYAKQLAKLCKSFIGSSPKRISKSKTDGTEKCDVRSTTLMNSINEIVDQVCNFFFFLFSFFFFLFSFFFFLFFFFLYRLLQIFELFVKLQITNYKLQITKTKKQDIFFGCKS